MWPSSLSLDALNSKSRDDFFHLWHWIKSRLHPHFLLLSLAFSPRPSPLSSRNRLFWSHCPMWVFLAWETLTPFSWLDLSSMSWGVSPGSWPARCFTSLCCVAPKWHYDGCAGFCAPGGQGMVASVCLIPLFGSQAHTHTCISSFQLLCRERVQAHLRDKAVVTQACCCPRRFPKHLWWFSNF